MFGKKKLKRELAECRKNLVRVERKAARDATKRAVRGDARRMLSERYLRGDGIEIGALHNPLHLPPHARARYLDYKDAAESRRQHPELDPAQIVEVDILARGDTLEGVPEGSLDFLVANHVLEHCEDVIGVLRRWLEVLREGGVLFFSVPDKRHTFDHRREVTPYGHLVRDHREGPGGSRHAHYIDFSRHVSGLSDAEMKGPDEVARAPLDIHFHVWTQTEIFELLVGLRRDFDLPIEVEAVVRNRLGTFYELIVVARRLRVEATGHA